jgi:hypothetical protein
MSEMRRWRDAGAPAAEIDRLLAAALPTRAMPASVRARLLARIGRTGGSGGTGGTGSQPPASGLVASKVFVIAAVIGAIGAAGLPVAFALFATHGAPAKAPVHPAPSATNHVREELPPAEPAASMPPDAPNTPLQAPQASTPSRPPPVRPSRTARPPSPESAPGASAGGAGNEDTLAREVALLERARARFDADPASTLAILEQHARAFPRGTLAIERELLAIDALERLGKTDDARARAERALGSARGTIYEARIRSRLVALH